MWWFVPCFIGPMEVIGEPSDGKLALPHLHLDFLLRPVRPPSASQKLEVHVSREVLLTTASLTGLILMTFVLLLALAIVW